MAKPKKGRPSTSSPIITRAISSADVNGDLVKFSFKYLDGASNPKFAFGAHDAAFFLQLLERLKAVSTMTIQEFRQNGSKALRAHPIDWDDTTEKGFGLPNEEQLAALPYQFSLSSNAYGRVHGFLIQNRFYVVWLDKGHRLYS